MTSSVSGSASNSDHYAGYGTDVSDCNVTDTESTDGTSSNDTNESESSSDTNESESSSEPTVVSVEYGEGCDAIEDVAQTIVTTAVSYGMDKVMPSDNGAVADITSAVVTSTVADQAGEVAKEIIREHSRDKTVHYSDDSRVEVKHSGATHTGTAYSSDDVKEREVEQRGSAKIIRECDEQGNVEKETYVIDGMGTYSYDKDGNYM